MLNKIVFYVNAEEIVVCSVPRCEDVTERDLTCPVTHWSAWSPCSVSCGKGFSVRTRLLLLPDAKRAEAEECRNVILSQRQHCEGHDLCHTTKGLYKIK